MIYSNCKCISYSFNRIAFKFHTCIKYDVIRLAFASFDDRTIFVFLDSSCLGTTSLYLSLGVRLLLATPCISKAWFVPPLCVIYLLYPAISSLDIYLSLCVRCWFVIISSDFIAGYIPITMCPVLVRYLFIDLFIYVVCERSQ